MDNWKDKLLEKFVSINVEKLNESTVAELIVIANDLKLENVSKLKKQELILKIVETQNKQERGDVIVPVKTINIIKDTVKNVIIPEIKKDIIQTPRKGGNTMITINAVNTDLDAIEKDEALKPEVKIIRALKVMMKFLSTMRSNQLLTEEEKKVIAEAK